MVDEDQRESPVSLQLLLNKMAEDGYRKSAVGHVRTYLKSCFEYAADEDLIRKSPARKLAMPKIQTKSFPIRFSPPSSKQ